MAVTDAERLARLTGWAGRGITGVDWAQAERELRVALPLDFRELAERFPPGTFQGYLDFAPGIASLADLRDRELGDLRRWRDGVFDAEDAKYQKLQDEPDASEGREPAPAPEFSCPYPLWPEPGGIFPWASASAGQLFCWLPGSPHPQSWPVVWCHGEDLVWERFEGTAVDFLIELVTGRIEVQRLGSPVFPPPPRFDQWQDFHFIADAGSVPPAGDYLEFIRSLGSEAGPGDQKDGT
jgi:hypothetical protein